MPTVSRRQFVNRSAVLAAATVAGVSAAAIAGPNLLRSRSDDASPASVLDHPASECPIDHVVILMMENRSFDHYLGWLGGDAAYLHEGRKRWGAGFTVEADNRQFFRGPNGAMVPTQSLIERPDDPNPYRLCSGPSPGHGWFTGRRQRDSGFLAKGTGNNENAIGYYTAEDVPVHAALARRFTVCDHHFSSVLGPTFPNRQYFHSGESEGRKSDPGPLKKGIFDSPTIWDKLTKANVSCGYYYTDNPASFLVFGDRLKPLVRNIDRYFADCAAGTLPNVSFIAPSFTGEFRSDNHPPGCINVGERFIHQITSAFVQGPQWQRGMLALFYDEWGGFFDHVRPPVFPDERASSHDADNFGQAGFRVPSIIASPFARENFVDTRAYDHTSVSRFLAWRFLGAPAEGPAVHGSRWYMGKRDRFAQNYGRSLSPGLPDPAVDLSLTLRRPTPLCGNDTNLRAIENDTDPFRISEELRAETEREFPGAQDAPWLR